MSKRLPKALMKLAFQEGAKSVSDDVDMDEVESDFYEWYGRVEGPIQTAREYISRAMTPNGCVGGEDE